MTRRLPPFLFIGTPSPVAVRHWADSGWRIVEGFTHDATGRLDGVVCIGRVDDRAAAADAVEAAARGAAIAVDGDDGCLDVVVDDAVRLGLEPAAVPPDTPGAAADDEWAPLLERLAAGESVADAARACHVSLRSAYRRLADARAAYGVSSNTAAVVAWQRSTGC